MAPATTESPLAPAAPRYPAVTAITSQVGEPGSSAAAGPDCLQLQPFGDAEAAALAEIAAVLQRHGLENRVTLGIRHDHWGLNDGEVAVETTRPSGRISTIQPVLASWLGDRGVPTQFGLDSQGNWVPLLTCIEG